MTFSDDEWKMKGGERREARSKGVTKSREIRRREGKRRKGKKETRTREEDVSEIRNKKEFLKGGKTDKDGN